MHIGLGVNLYRPAVAEIWRAKDTKRTKRIFSHELNTDETRILTGKTTQKFFTHFIFVRAMMSFAVMIWAKRSNILFDVETFFAQWNHMMSFKIDSSVCHRKAGRSTPFTISVGSQQNIPANNRTANKCLS